MKMLKKTYTIEASPNVIKTLERFLVHLEYCCGVGHSTSVGIGIDGDGADRFKILDPKLEKNDKNDIYTRNMVNSGPIEFVRYSD